MLAAVTVKGYSVGQSETIQHFYLSVLEFFLDEHQTEEVTVAQSKTDYGTEHSLGFSTKNAIKPACRSLQN